MSNAAGEIEFTSTSTGGTGDHIGFNQGEAKHYLKKSVTKVSTNTLDDLILNAQKEWVNNAPIYFLKIDTQGHDVAVIQGASKLLKQHRIQFLVMEYWPIATKNTINIPITTGMKILKQSGYSVFDLELQSPGNPPSREKQWLHRPLSFHENEQWFLDYSIQTGDQFGRGADVFAMAPEKTVQHLFKP